MTTEIVSQAERIRHGLGTIEDRDELRHMALSSLLGPIRDKLKAIVAEIDAVAEVLEARGEWDD